MKYFFIINIKLMPKKNNKNKKKESSKTTDDYPCISIHNSGSFFRHRTACQTAGYR